MCVRFSRFCGTFAVSAITCAAYLVDPNGENCRGEKDGELDGCLVHREWYFRI